MRGLSNEARHLLQLLHESRHGVIGRLLTPSHRRPESILRDLAETGEWLTIPGIVGLLASDRPTIREATALTIHRLLDHMKPIGILSLAEQFSHMEYQYHDDEWRQIKGDQVAKLLNVLPAEHHPSVIGILSLHRSGYVREKALEAGSNMKSGRLLTFLLLRQNDWVGKVAHLAQQLVAARLTPDHAKDFRDNLPLIVHLAHCRRESLTESVSQAVALVLSESSVEELSETLKLTNRDVRFAVLRQAFETQVPHHEALLLSGMESQDCVTRLHCFRMFLSLHASSGQPDFFKRLHNFQRDRFMPIRRVAYTTEAELCPDSAVSIWKLAMLDSKQSIRELAHFWLRRLGVSDLAAGYRQTVHADPSARGALEGLADLAESEDEPFFEELLNHPIPRYRCIAIRAIVGIKKVEGIPRILPLLISGHACLIKAVSKSLASLGEKLSGQQLLDIVTQATTDHIQHIAIRMMMDLGKWASIPWLLKCACLPDPALSAFAARMIEARLESQRVFIKPTAKERGDIEQELSLFKNPKFESTRELIIEQLMTFA
jgi:hypothetical protein